MVAIIVVTSACTVFPPPPPDAGIPADSGPPPGCREGFLGSPSGTPELILTVLRPDGTTVDIADGDLVPMMFPDQGGRVIFAGVRANNVNACGVKLTGALRDATNQQVRLDGRITNLRRYDGGMGGSVASDTSTFSNIPVCPNQWSVTDLFTGTYALEMTLKDQAGRTVERTIHVRPFCAEPANERECRCICRQGYDPDVSCDDAGIPVTTDGGP